MRRAALLAGIWLGAAAWIGAREHGAPGAEAPSGAEHAPGGPAHVDLWKLANFVLFVGVLGYALRQPAARFFRSRTAAIQEAIAEAARWHEQAEQRCASIEERLANLSAETDALRAKVHEEMAAEEERWRRQLEADLRKIQADAEQEIAAAVKAAEQQLRAEAAELAVGLAAMEIRRRLSPAVDERWIREMVRDIERRSPGVS